MKLNIRLTGMLTALTLVASPLAMADTSRTEGTIVGAAVGGVAGSLIGNNMESTLLGAAAGGLLGNLLAKNNANYTREGYYNNRYYYGGREFRTQKDYDAYREAVRRDMLRDKEARRYSDYRDFRREYLNNRDERRESRRNDRQERLNNWAERRHEQVAMQQQRFNSWADRQNDRFAMRQERIEQRANAWQNRGQRFGQDNHMWQARGGHR